MRMSAVPLLMLKTDASYLGFLPLESLHLPAQGIYSAGKKPCMTVPLDKQECGGGRRHYCKSNPAEYLLERRIDSLPHYFGVAGEEHDQKNQGRGENAIQDR